MKKIILDTEFPTLNPKTIKDTHGDMILKHTKDGDLVTIRQISNFLKTPPQTIDYVMRVLVADGHFENMGFKSLPHPSGRRVKALVYRRIDKAS